METFKGKQSPMGGSLLPKVVVGIPLDCSAPAGRGSQNVDRGFLRGTVAGPVVGNGADLLYTALKCY